MKKTGLVPQYAITIRRNVRVKAAEGVDRLTPQEARISGSDVGW